MQLGQKLAHVNIVGVTADGDTITVPRGEKLDFDRDLRDWRKVRIVWIGKVLTISRAAWDRCSASESNPSARRF